MKKKIIIRGIVMIFVCMLTGCAGEHTKSTMTESNIEESTDSIDSEAEVEGNEQQTIEPTSEPISESTPIPTLEPTPEPTPVVPEEEKKDEYGMTEQQRNSFSMLYYLAITAEEIRISKDNRLLLDDIYMSLLNDINPGSIDETTQEHLNSLRKIIKSYINISVKRERLQYIYNQEKAAVIKNALPDPAVILSVASKLDWKKLVVNVTYTLEESYNNYKATSEAIDREFLISGWELDDKETTTIQENREKAFDYMVDIVQEYGLDGKLILNQKAIESFAEICAIESVQQKIRRLESEEETYKLLGNYWLELADCYYETNKYEKCLECIEKYNKLSTGIFLKDYNYVQILPKAIVAAQEIYEGDKYVQYVGDFAKDIFNNTTTEDWSLRYFLAQVYLDLYARTDESFYLKEAYKSAYDNVAVLVGGQKELNDTYLNAIKEVEIKEPTYETLTEDEKKKREKEYKEEQKRVKEYNNSLKEKRETELPVLYEPLILNCELLFALADEMNISDIEKAEIEEILQTSTNGVFLSKVINDRYSFRTSQEEYSIEFSKGEVKIPVYMLSEEAKVIISVNDIGKTVTFGDCKVTKVDRKNSQEFDAFVAHYSSKDMKDYEWTPNSEITVIIFNGYDYEPITLDYVVKEYKDNWIGKDKVVFEQK